MPSLTISGTGGVEVRTSDLGPSCTTNQNTFRTAAPQIIAVGAKNLLLLGYGMTLGFSTVLIPAVSGKHETEVLKLNAAQTSWISSINLIVVPLGCALSGIITQPIGRKRSMQLINIPFFVAWLLFSFSTSYTHICIALALTGLAGGILEAPVLTYVSEITQPHLRGFLSATSSLCIILGVFTQFIMGNFFYWRTMALINIAFTILAMVAISFIPESPYWLVSKSRFEDARKSLQWLRGWTTAAAVEIELRDIKIIYQYNDSGIETSYEMDSRQDSIKGGLSNYTKMSFLKALFLVSFSFFVGHFSGMTTLQTYAVYIFEKLKSPIDYHNATMILGLIQILGSVVCVSLVHYSGKRALAIFSTAAAGICCISLSAYQYYLTKVTKYLLSDDSPQGESDLQLFQTEYEITWLPLGIILTLAFVTHTGIRLLPWMLIGEVFSAKTRSGASGISSAVGYIFGFLTNKTFLNMVNTMDLYGTYLLYGVVSFVGCCVLHFILPETEGKTLKQIEDHFSGVQRLETDVTPVETVREAIRPMASSTLITQTNEGYLHDTAVTRF